MGIRVLAPMVIVALGFCAGADAGVTLKAVRFPATLTGTGGTKAPPQQAPLSQRVVLEFDGKPKIGIGIDAAVSIRVSAQNVLGQPTGQRAFGTFSVSGRKLIFTPRLPTEDFGPGFGPHADLASNAGWPGLLPQTTYEITLDPSVPNGIKNFGKAAAGIAFPIVFTTAPTTVGSAGIAGYFAFATAPAPKLLKKNGIAPKPNSSGLHPNVLSDPTGVFQAIPQSKRPPFTLRFGVPLNPAAANLGERLRVRAVLDSAAQPIDVEIPRTTALVENQAKRSTVLLYPNATLPFGTTLVVEVSNRLENLAGISALDGASVEIFKEVARYTVATDPQPGTPLAGAIVEEFSGNEHEDTSPATSATPLASWNGQTAGALRAAFAFGGDGSLGAFLAPTSAPITITLDTDLQSFPLLSGATPDAAPGTIVKGGVFEFTEFHLPANCTLRGVGSNPLVITATGNVLIEGSIDCSGFAGTGDDTFNSAIAPAPGGSGGPGGGKGGDGHPVFVPKGAKSLIYMVTPQFGQSGAGPGNAKGQGGGGGQSGATLPWSSFGNGTNCAIFADFADGSRGSGGGGGSFNVFLPLAPEPIGVPISGRRGGVGIGNHLPIAFSPGLPFPTPTLPKAYDGVSFNAVARPNPNPTFAQAVQLGLIFDGPANGALVLNTAWSTSRRVTFGGEPGPAVFADADPNNDFIGAGGELAELVGGQGGGAGGSRTEGLSLDCSSASLAVGLPLTVLDAKGGGGGGGGGAVLIQALGEIRIQGTSARIRAIGGGGRGGESTQDAEKGGGGGGGSGGAVVLQSGVNVVMVGTANPAGGERVIDVSAGCGCNATVLTDTAPTGTPGGDQGSLQVGDGAPGGPGIVQVHVPAGVVPTLVASQIGARVWRRVVYPNAPGNCSYNNAEFIDVLVPTAKTPVPFGSRSIARSTWFDLGLVQPPFRAPIQTPSGAVAGPLFGIPGGAPLFTGTDPLTGYVVVDGQGTVIGSESNHFELDSPDLGVPDYLPQDPTPQTVRIRFQGAPDDPSNPGFPDLAQATAFVADATLLNGSRHVRFEVEFDLAAGNPTLANPSTPKPQLNVLRLPFQY